MSEDEINRAIADHFGWRIVSIGCHGLKDVAWLPPGALESVQAFDSYGSHPPNYCGDLNAIQSAVIQIRDGIVGDSNKRRFEWGVANELYLMTGDVPAMFRPASKWCEALLRFVGKWKENE